MNNLQPASVWHYFQELCKVPRPSFKTQKAQQWLLDFAKEHGLESIHDKTGNIIIRKPASAGRENAKPVILQGHIDMVCEKNNDVQHDFEKDPIDFYVEDDWMRARGTTLGADNGIAVAMALAVLAADDIKHGPIECLFTVDEEVGLVGASGIEPGLLQGKTLINLDSEDDHWVCIGCAGGINTLAQFAYETMETPAGMYYFKVCITGLKGGHSGTDINAGRGNANQLLVRFLYEEAQQNELYISSFQGGNLSNAIPREAACIAAVPFASKEQLRVRLNLFEAALQAEFGKNEPDLKLTLDSIDAPATMLKPEYATRFLQSMYACPNGVIRMNKDMPEQVDTSTNLASVKPTAGKENEWTIVTSQRSSIESSKIDVVNRIRAIFELAGMTTTHTEGYPGWAPNTESPLLKVMVDVHKEMYGEAPVVYAIHAGLECGLFLQKYPDWDMVSIGPTMRGVHSPDECLYVPSVESVWNYLLAILERL